MQEVPHGEMAAQPDPTEILKCDIATGCAQRLSRPTPLEFSIGSEGRKRVICNLPDEPVRISEVTVIPAPEHVLRGFQDACAGRFGICQNSDNLLLIAAIVTKRRGCIWGKIARSDTDIFRQFFDGIQPEYLPDQVKDNNAVRTFNPLPAERRVKDQRPSRGRRPPR